MPDIPADRLYLGGELDERRERSGVPTLLDPDELVTHGVIVGMTGSGKTGLALVLLEELLLQGVPMLAIDPKGDLGNLALTFPGLSAAEFEPWVDPGAALKAGLSAEALAEQTAAAWRNGLAGWGIDTTRVGRLRDAAPVTVYTPGSTAGVPLNLVGTLAAPTGDLDPEARHAEIEGFTTGLLAMAGLETDPLSSPEHILLTNLIADQWDRGRSLDLPGLLALVQDPPMRKLGVLELDAFFPPKDRHRLLARLNGLLASPSFRSWAQGAALDPATLLWAPDGRPRAAVVNIAHLSDAERQFVVAVLLAKVVTWMRAQPGTAALRALVYMDEVAGFVPPTAAPPSKKPILTIAKQARAFGVGMVLATQNPVDLDYKALSNAGTWIIGRLQTERDKARLLDGLTTASGEVDVGRIGSVISSLDRRQFVLQRAGSSGPAVFTSRWAMCYLRGPFTREELSELARSGAGERAGADGAEPREAPTDEASLLHGDHDSDLHTPLPPAPAAGITVRHLDPAAPWAPAAGADPPGHEHAAALVAAVRLRFRNTRADVDESAEWEAVLHPLGPAPDWSTATLVDHDPRDFRDGPPPSGRFRLPDAPLNRATYFRDAERRLVAHLAAEENLELWRNSELGVVQRPGEPDDRFRARVESAADAKADEEAAALRTKVAARSAKLRDAIEDADLRVSELRRRQRDRQTETMVRAAGGLVSAFLGGRRSSRSLARTISTATGSVASPGSAGIEAAERRAERSRGELARLEEDLAAQLLDIDRRWSDAAARVDRLRITLSRADITVQELFLCWIPVG